MKFIVQGDSIESFDTKNGSKTVRRLSLIGETDLSEQICQCDLSKDTPAVGKGKVVEMHVKAVAQLFNGKPRLDAVLLNVGK